MLHGNFKSKNHTYTVRIDCGLDYQIGSSERKIHFTDNPVTITQDVDDTFAQIIKTSATVSLISQEYIGDYIFTANDREISVKIYQDGYNCIFDGYVEPNTFNQDFNTDYTEITLNCQDYLCTLENHRYKEQTDYPSLKLQAANKSFLAYLQEILGTSRNVFYDTSLKDVNTNNWENIFSHIGISELLVLGDEEDDLWTQEDILNEMLQYLNLHIVQMGRDFYIFNWASIKGNSSIYWKRIIGNAQSKTVTIPTITVQPEHYKSDDTNISISDVYNKIVVQCDLEEQEELLQSPLDEDSIISPYTNRNLYLREYKQGSSEQHNWYFKYLMNPNWKLRYYDNGTVKDVDNIIQEYNLLDSDGVAYMQYKIAQVIDQHKLAPIICAMGKVNSEKSVTDNTISNNLQMNNYLIITINGSENKDIGDAAVQEWNTISEALEDAGGMIEYKSSTTAGVLSPTDDATTNYLVFSGSMMLQPPLRYRDYGDYFFSPRAEVYAYWRRANYPNESGTDDYNLFSLIPYLGYGDFKNKYSEYYGDWLYYKDEAGTDTVSKVPVLICEMKIGDKYCVEVSENNFRWLTQAQCDNYRNPDGTIGVEPVFTLGFNPAIGDYFLCKEWAISNTLHTSSNVDAEGTAIPITKDDNLSGQVSFKILSPYYYGWNQQIRRHPTLFRSTKWWTTQLPIMEFVRDIYIKNFQCKLYSNNGMSDMEGDKDLIYMSDVMNNSIQSKDDITFKFNTALTTTECLSKGISTTAKLSNVINMDSNSSLGRIQNKYTDTSGYAEELYINDYYLEYNQPKLIVETSLDYNSTGYWNHYQFAYFSGKVFYVIGTEIDLINESVTYKLKEI